MKKYNKIIITLCIVFGNLTFADLTQEEQKVYDKVISEIKNNYSLEYLKKQNPSSSVLELGKINLDTEYANLYTGDKNIHNYYNNTVGKGYATGYGDISGLNIAYGFGNSAGVDLVENIEFFDENDEKIEKMTNDQYENLPWEEKSKIRREITISRTTKKDNVLIPLWDLNTKKESAYSTAIGFVNAAYGAGSFVIGTHNAARGEGAFAGGKSSQAVNGKAFAFGENVKALGENSIAFGNETKATGRYSVVFGYKSNAYGDSSFAFGWEANAKGNNSIAWEITVWHLIMGQ